MKIKIKMILILTLTLTFLSFRLIPNTSWQTSKWCNNRVVTAPPSHLPRPRRASSRNLLCQPHTTVPVRARTSRWTRTARSWWRTSTWWCRTSLQDRRRQPQTRHRRQRQQRWEETVISNRVPWLSTHIWWILPPALDEVKIQINLLLIVICPFVVIYSQGQHSD